MLAEAQRGEMLAAMGVDVYVLRGIKSAAATKISSNIRIAVVCAKDDARYPQAACLRKLLPLALGCQARCIDWIELADIEAKIALPTASVYLVLGANVARAANAQMADVDHGAVLVAVADAPQLSLHDTLAKRALWQAIKPIVRHLRQSHS